MLKSHHLVRHISSAVMAGRERERVCALLARTPAMQPGHPNFWHGRLKHFTPGCCPRLVVASLHPPHPRLAPQPWLTASHYRDRPRVLGDKAALGHQEPMFKLKCCDDSLYLADVIMRPPGGALGPTVALLCPHGGLQLRPAEPGRQCGGDRTTAGRTDPRLGHARVGRRSATGRLPSGPTTALGTNFLFSQRILDIYSIAV